MMTLFILGPAIVEILYGKRFGYGQLPSSRQHTGLGRLEIII
jgi:hypothetical protein